MMTVVLSNLCREVIDAGSNPQHPKHFLQGSSLLTQHPIVYSYSYLLRLKILTNPLAISLGLGANQPKMRRISIRGSTSVFLVVLVSCTTVSTGASTLSCGLVEVFNPTFCVFSLPICVFAATLVPPPDRNEGILVQLLTVRRRIVVISIRFAIDINPKEACPSPYNNRYET